MLDALKIVSDSAQTHSGWAIALIGGSLAAIVGTSHYSPHGRLGRCIYLIFIPAWLYLGLSVYYGDRVFRNYIAAALAPQDANHLLETGSAMNQDYIEQQESLFLGVLSCIAWLLAYLAWWITCREVEKK